MIDGEVDGENGMDIGVDVGGTAAVADSTAGLGEAVEAMRDGGDDSSEVDDASVSTGAEVWFEVASVGREATTAQPDAVRSPVNTTVVKAILEVVTMTRPFMVTGHAWMVASVEVRSDQGPAKY